MTRKRKTAFSRTKSLAFAFSAVAASAALVALASALSLGEGVFIHGSKVPSWLATCAVAGVGEELVFRLLLFRLLLLGFEQRGARRPSFLAALVQAALFGLLHVSSANGAVAPEGAIEWFQFAGKPAQAFLFGLLMAFLYERTETLAAPIAAHVGYDLACFFPSMVLAGADVTSHVTGSALDAAALVITSVFFAVALFAVARARG